MVIAIVLVLLVVGSVLFHLLSPWYFTPIASNWSAMDKQTKNYGVPSPTCRTLLAFFMRHSVLIRDRKPVVHRDSEAERQAPAPAPEWPRALH